MRSRPRNGRTLSIYLPNLSKPSLLFGINLCADYLESLYVGREDDEQAGTMLAWILQAFINEADRREHEAAGEPIEVQTLHFPELTSLELSDALRDIQIISYLGLPAGLASEVVDPLVQTITAHAIVRLRQCESI